MRFKLMHVMMDGLAFGSVLPQCLIALIAALRIASYTSYGQLNQI